MKTAFLIGICLLVGCSQEPSQWQQAMRAIDAGQAESEIYSTAIIERSDESLLLLKDHTTALAAIQSQVESLAAETREAVDTLKASLISSNPNGKESDPASALEPQETTRANLSQPIIPVALSPAVRLFVSTTSACPPCRRLKKAVDDGEFSGFEITYDDGFSGMRGYPAIRFETPKTATGWGVVYGYDDTTIPTLRAMTQGIKEQPVTLIDHGTRSPVVRIKSTRRGLFGLFR